MEIKRRQIAPTGGGGGGDGVVTSDDVSTIVTLTQAEYDALTPDPAALYIVTD